MKTIATTLAATVLGVSGLTPGSNVQADSFSISVSDAYTSFTFSVHEDDAYYRDYYEVPVYIIRERGWRPRVYGHHHRHHKPDQHYRKYGHHKHDKHYRKHGHHKPDKYYRKHGYHEPDRHDGKHRHPGRAHLTRTVHRAAAGS